MNNITFLHGFEVPHLRTPTPSDHYLAHLSLCHIRGQRPPPSMCFCLHSGTNGDDSWEFSRVSRFGLGVVLSTEGFPTGFSQMTSLPVRTPSAKVPHPPTPTPSDHYLTHPPLNHIRGQRPPPIMCFCLHSVANGQAIWLDS